MPLTPTKKRKIPAKNSVESNLPILQEGPNIESFFANEIMINVFKFLPRNVLDKCRLVNRRWNDIIDIHGYNFARRSIDKLNIYSEFCQNFITFGGFSLASRSEIQYVLDGNDHVGVPGIVHILKNSNIKCLVIGPIDLCDSNAEQILSVLQGADTHIMEIQMRRVGLGNITVKLFHKFCEKINTKRYAFSEMRQAQNEYFGNEFFNKMIFKESSYIYIKGLVANALAVPVAVDDETLLDFIFGVNIKSVERKVACLELPSISSQFVTKILNRFANEADITHMVTEATLLLCPPQTVLRSYQSLNIRLGYVNYASYNVTENKELQVEIIKQKGYFVNVFLSLGEKY
uniref:F-box domain-containing protein n=1 Tax=Panagrolaimus superbus TaxID=310955 RepID=A0A914XXU9_9BILA